MSSRFSSELKIPDWDANGLDPEFVAWLLLLQNAGYTTGLIGKWRLGSRKEEHHPTSHGYDYFMGFQNGGKPRDAQLTVAAKAQQVPGLLLEVLTDDAMQSPEGTIVTIGYRLRVLSRQTVGNSTYGIGRFPIPLRNKRA